MGFDHEKLDVYRLGVEFTSYVYRHCVELDGLHRHVRDHLFRAAFSIPLNIAEGNGKFAGPDRRRFLQIACGSAMECSACVDVLVVTGGMSNPTATELKNTLVRIVSMLVRLIQQTGGSVREDTAPYGFACENENENEYEND